MFPKKEPLVELKNLRCSHTFNSDDPTSWYRYYRKGKQVFVLHKTSTPASSFELVEVPKGGASELEDGRSIKVNGLINWGEAFSWADAERAIMEVLGAACIQRDHETENIQVVSGK